MADAVERLPFKLARPNPNTGVTDAADIDYGKTNVKVELDKINNNVRTDSAKDCLYIADSTGAAIAKFDATGLTVFDVKVIENSRIVSLPTKISDKVDKVAGKGLSTEDFTTSDKDSLANINEAVDVNFNDILYIADSNGNVMAKFDALGLHVAAIYAKKDGVEKNLLSIITSALSDLDISSRMSDSFYITDSSGRIMMKINGNGVSAAEIRTDRLRHLNGTPYSSGGGGDAGVCDRDTTFAGITFWGSSSTEASWIQDVADALDMPYYWGGVGGENIWAIAGRMGVLPLRLRSDLTIPASKNTPVVFGESQTYRFYQRWNGRYTQLAAIWTSKTAPEYKLLVNPCYIAGVKGVIGGGGQNSGNPCYFQRLEDGEEVIAKQYEPIYTYGFQQTRDSIWFLACHFNGGESDNTELVALYKKMVEYNTSGRVLILGRHRTANNEETITSPTLADLQAQEVALEDEFGLMFFNTRAYMTSYGWEQYKKLYPNGYDAADELDASQGIPPNCLYANDTNVHFNSKGYGILSDAIIERLRELGYNLYRAGGEMTHPTYS